MTWDRNHVFRLWNVNSNRSSLKSDRMTRRDSPNQGRKSWPSSYIQMYNGCAWNFCVDIINLERLILISNVGTFLSFNIFLFIQFTEGYSGLGFPTWIRSSTSLQVTRFLLSTNCLEIYFRELNILFNRFFRYFRNFIFSFFRLYVVLGSWTYV